MYMTFCELKLMRISPVKKHKFYLKNIQNEIMVNTNPNRIS